ncbi:adenine deaminase [Ammoniphilus sp. YIM 78166]|uniref:adenine deaminase n=1 Tax=Ammoniphilus sp. YIM 78166 TaxID=1644106 RepID=UPI00106F7966|nr:adenine deaminase [Ammoniphilus sp. YIM 78166]
MDKLQEDLKKRILVAGHELAADLVIKNARIINVFTGEIMDGDVAITDGMIAGIGSYQGKKFLDAQGQYLIPGFIDGHVHIESAMVLPKELAKVLLPHGVTTIIADPHEIANVHGVEGLQFMLQSIENLSLDVYYMLPSSVPATPFENAGARLLAEDLISFYSHSNVLGLAEVMDFPSVKKATLDMLQKLSTAHNQSAKIDGHAAGLSYEALNIYMAAGIRTDHEAVSVEDARNRLSLGMYLMIRQGSVARDLINLLPAITPSNAKRCLFVTDDKHLDDLLEEGSIDHNVRLAIQNGIEPITAIQMATLNVAECFGLTDVGAIAPGYKADLLLLENLESISISHVLKHGDLVYQKGSHLQKSTSDSNSAPIPLPNSVNLAPLSLEQLSIPLASARCNVIGIIPNSLVTQHLQEEVDVKDGVFVASTENDLLKLAVLERHHQTGNIGLGIVKGFGLKRGAIASTIAHDSHNLICVGVKDEDMLLAIRHLEKVKGGLVVAHSGKILASLPLPVAGLMSDRPYLEVYDGLKEIAKGLRYLEASEQFNPFLTLSFLALPVIPQLKLTDLGLFDFSQFKHIPIEVDG